VKKILVISCIVLSIAVSLFFGIKIYMHYQSVQYENTALPYVKMVIPEISKWDSEIIKQYMSPEVLAGISEDNLQNTVSNLSKLGSLIKMREPKYSNSDTFPTKSGIEIKIVTYKIDAEYENGNADITLGLLEKGESFQVHNFNMNPKMLSQ